MAGYIYLPPVTDPTYIAKYGLVPQGVSGTWQMGNFIIFANGTYVDITQWDPTTGMVPLQGPDPAYVSSPMAQFDPSTVMPNVLNTTAPTPTTVTPAPTQTVLTPPPTSQVPTYTQIVNGSTPTDQTAAILDSATAWAETHWGLLAAGVAAVILVPALLGRR